MSSYETTIPTLSYGAAMERLSEIVEQIESTAIGVDELESAVKEAVCLINHCRSRLTGAQNAVEQALGGLRPEAADGP